MYLYKPVLQLDLKYHLEVTGVPFTCLLLYIFFSTGWGASAWESTGIYWTSEQIWQWKDWSYGEVSKVPTNCFRLVFKSSDEQQGGVPIM